MNLLKKCIAEFLGSFAIVFVGCGAIASQQIDSGVSHLGVSLSFGLIVMCMIYGAGHISGAHYNPAVTIAFSLTRHFPVKEILPYIISQLTGAIFGAFLLCVIFENIFIQKFGSTAGILSHGVTRPVDGIYLTAFLMETVLTFLLMFVIMSVATDYRATGKAAGMAIGGVVCLEAIFAGPLCGASMNPARSLGPAIVSFQFDFIFAYIIGPIVGAILGAFTYNFIRCENSSKSDAKGCC